MNNLCLSEITSVILWIQLACVQFSQYPISLEIQYRVMFIHKVMWSRGPHRPVAWNKACSGVNNNHLDCRVAAHSFPAHTIQRWKLKLVSQVPQTEKLAFFFIILSISLTEKRHPKPLPPVYHFWNFWPHVRSYCVPWWCVCKCIFKSHFLFLLCSLQRSFH